MSDKDDNIKTCPHCGNIMMTESKENIAEYVCITCKFSEEIKETTLLSFNKLTKDSINEFNPRTMHESTSALNPMCYRKCINSKCVSKNKITKHRKVLFDNGDIKYFCQENDCK